MSAQAASVKVRWGGLARLGVWLLAAVGCAALRPAPLDVLPGFRIVLCRMDVSRLDAPGALIEILSADGAVAQELRAGWGQRDFAFALPPGRYGIFRVRVLADDRQIPAYPIRYVRVGFEVGPEPAVYLGTLRLTPFLGDRLGVEVVDEYDDTVARLRAWYPEIPGTIARSLMRAA